MVPCKARAIGLGSTTGGISVRRANASPIKILEMDGALILGGCRSIKTRSNQPIVSRIGRRDAIEEAGWGRGGAGGGDAVQLFGAAIGRTKNKKIKYILAFGGIQLTAAHTTTNQPTNNRQPRQRRGWRGGATSMGPKGSMIPLFLEGAKLKGGGK